jgi:prepilin-type N-terminal cleavage/methylation domain-containing protein
MYSFRKSKKGFTLIELMVVVAIIGVLALLGLRLYTGQQAKAKNAVVKANCGTIQTLIQAELADHEVGDLDTAGERTTLIFAEAGIYNPVSGSAQAADETKAAAAEGEVWVDYSNNVFSINGKAAGSTVGDTKYVYTHDLTARK